MCVCVCDLPKLYLYCTQSVYYVGIVVSNIYLSTHSFVEKKIHFKKNGILINNYQ